jgi:hypothetical protein
MTIIGLLIPSLNSSCFLRHELQVLSLKEVLIAVYNGFRSG